MGWAVTKRRWAGGTALMHNGDNTMSTRRRGSARQNIVLRRGVHVDCQEASEACDEAIEMLINRF